LPNFPPPSCKLRLQGYRSFLRVCSSSYWKTFSIPVGNIAPPPTPSTSHLPLFLIGKIVPFGLCSRRFFLIVFTRGTRSVYLKSVSRYGTGCPSFGTQRLNPHPLAYFKSFASNNLAKLSILIYPPRFSSVFVISFLAFLVVYASSLFLS